MNFRLVNNTRATKKINYMAILTFPNQKNNGLIQKQIKNKRCQKNGRIKMEC